MYKETHVKKDKKYFYFSFANVLKRIHISTNQDNILICAMNNR